MAMSIGAVAGGFSTQAALKPEALEPKGPTGKDARIDGDGDDAGSANTVKTTVNTQGQTLGQFLNVKA